MKIKNILMMFAVLFLIGMFFASCAKTNPRSQSSNSAITNTNKKELLVLDSVDSDSSNEESVSKSVSSNQSTSSSEISSSTISTSKIESSTPSAPTKTSSTETTDTSSYFHYDNGLSGAAHVEVNQTPPPIQRMPSSSVSVN